MSGAQSCIAGNHVFATTLPTSSPGSCACGAITITTLVQGHDPTCEDPLHEHSYSTVEWMEAARQQGRAEAAAPVEGLRMDQPWSVLDIVRTLADYADHALDVHGCDVDGYERVMAARDAGREWLAALRAIESPAHPSVPAGPLTVEGRRALRERTEQSLARPRT